MRERRGPGDAGLVRRARAGDRKAFGQLVRRYQNAAYATALSCVGNGHDAMDVVQDAFVGAYCGLGRLRDGEQFAPWLRTIVRRRAADWLRTRRSSAVQAMSAAGAGLVQASLRRSERQRAAAEVWEAVQALPEKFREVVLLHYFERWTYDRIARFMGLPTSTVKGRLQTARTRLRECLVPLKEEARTMKRARIDREVEEAICKIATEEIDQKIPAGDTQRIVIFCGLAADIEVCQTGGDEVVLTGTKVSLGSTEQQAKASVTGIEVWSDQVNDWFESGPHESEVFAGTNTDKDGNPQGLTTRASEMWRHAAPAVPKGLWFTPEYDRLYGDLSRPHAAMAKMATSTDGRAIRITIGREKMEDIVLRKPAFPEEVARAFTPNYGDENLSHGPVGRVNLTVGLPAGRHLTVVALWYHTGVCARALRGDLTVIGALEVRLEDVEGDVCLVDSLCQEARNVRGRFVQTFYGIAGGDSRNWTYRRGQLPAEVRESRLRDIRGETWIDAATLDLEATDLEGDVHIRNCFGSTRVYKNSHQPGDRMWLETHSGGVTVFLKEDLIGEVNLTATSITGTLRYEALKGLGWVNARNNFEIMMVSTIPTPGPGYFPAKALEADICIKTRTGEVTIEKTV